MPGELLTYPIRSTKLALQVEVRERVLDRQTEFQRIEVLDTDALGRILLLDGHVQLATFDEHAYHEALVHIPLFAVASPRRALVVGGGDGGVLRELCKHPGLEVIEMVEIDRGVVDAAREALPSLSSGAFDDPRVTLHIADAFGFVREVTEPYDFIVMDVTDVYEEETGELSEQLFTETFYRDCARALAPGGILVTQADNLVFCPYSMEGVVANYAPVFAKVGAYQALVPSFGGFSGYTWASHGAEPPHAMPASGLALRYLNPTTYALAFEPLPFGDALALGVVSGGG